MLFLTGSFTRLYSFVKNVTLENKTTDSPSLNSYNEEDYFRGQIHAAK